MALGMPEKMDEKARKCLLVMCGIPGAGKSSLAEALVAPAAAASVAISIINFDDHMAQETEHNHANNDEFDPEQWKVMKRMHHGLQVASTNSRPCPPSRPPEPPRWLCYDRLSAWMNHVAV
jgi:hypothetical protein